MAVFIYGIAGILVFFLVILGIGIWAGRKSKDKSEDELLLAGRSIGWFVGTMTLIATWVGGGYINGTAQAMYTTGLAWCQVPIGYSICFLVGVWLFIKPMREAQYITMLDPFQEKYGKYAGLLIFLPALFGDVFWTASILSSLGSSLVVILGLDAYISVIISSLFAAAYTVVGGFYSVTYTDMIQMFCIMVGLIISAPIAYFHPALNKEKMATTDWLGEIRTDDIFIWIEGYLLLILGGIPWQLYFQRVLAIKSTTMAVNIHYLAMMGCFISAIPAMYIGILARGVDWTIVDGFNRNITSEEQSAILPIVLRYLTPNWAAFFGLGAVSAASMSSSDAGILSSSSMFARNIYKGIFKQKASENEVVWVLRASVLVVTAFAAGISLTVTSVYYLSFICADLVYVIIFPQLLLLIQCPQLVNSYGCITGYFVGLIVRLLGGEPGVSLPPAIRFPNFDEKNNIQKFPFKTLAMLLALFSQLLISWITKLLFENNILSITRWDFFHVFDESHGRLNESNSTLQRVYRNPKFETQQPKDLKMNTIVLRSAKIK